MKDLPLFARRPSVALASPEKLARDKIRFDSDA